MAKKWYHGGLAFSCTGCGNCCSGPEEGYIFANEKELQAAADFLKMPLNELKRKYTYKIGRRYSYTEQKPSNDCIFLRDNGKGGKGCMIYPVRPRQCRTWPFWDINLCYPDNWQDAAEDCPGIDHGTFYEFDEIINIMDGDGELKDDGLTVQEAAMQWIDANLDNKAVFAELDELYGNLNEYIESAGGTCNNCGRCCDFENYGHRLYVTTLEMLYFWGNLKKEGIEPLEVAKGLCSYQGKDGCLAHKYRPTGCRIFYCQGLPDEFQHELSERILMRLRALHQRHGAAYLYTDLLTWLGK
ncbi:MAG: YkgJ family cysteine cluster protein [Phycisphaerae bacterium]|nr:YkgJ family cysteine cluster protein [Phycisphaerae bacterium]